MQTSKLENKSLKRLEALRRRAWHTYWRIDGTLSYLKTIGIPCPELADRIEKQMKKIGQINTAITLKIRGNNEQAIQD